MDLIENTEKEKLESLERFVLDNSDLEKIEGLLSEFNVFESLKIVHAEIRHSNVLEWLFDPKSNHGLGAYFLNQFLKRFLVENKEFVKGLNVFDIGALSFSDVEIRREWNNIDLLILIRDENKKIAITIENKILSGEHSNQLKRYRNIIESDFPEFERIFIYLTPDNKETINDEWLSFSYEGIATLLDNLILYRRDVINENVYSFINQYNKTLKRYLVGNSEIEKICIQIYNKHKSALDLIFQYKPDIEYGIKEHLEKLIKEHNLILEQSSKAYIRFATNIFDLSIPREGEGWLKSQRMFVFEFNNQGERLNLNLYIGPGSSNLRIKLHEFCNSNKAIFNNVTLTLNKKWNNVFTKKFLSSSDLDENDLDLILDKVNKKWAEFLKNDLPQINECVKTKWK